MIRKRLLIRTQAITGFFTELSWPSSPLGFGQPTDLWGRDCPYKCYTTNSALIPQCGANDTCEVPPALSMETLQFPLYTNSYISPPLNLVFGTNSIWHSQRTLFIVSTPPELVVVCGPCFFTRILRSPRPPTPPYGGSPTLSGTAKRSRTIHNPLYFQPGMRIGVFSVYFCRLPDPDHTIA